MVIIPAVDRLSRDTTDLLIIAREMRHAGAGIRSPAEPFLDTTSDFAEIIFAILGLAAKLERRRILERTARGRADARANGVKFGRKPIQQQEARKRLEAGGRSAASPTAITSRRVRFHGCSRMIKDDLSAQLQTILTNFMFGVGVEMLLPAETLG